MLKPDGQAEPITAEVVFAQCKLPGDRSMNFKVSTLKVSRHLKHAHSRVCIPSACIVFNCPLIACITINARCRGDLYTLAAWHERFSVALKSRAVGVLLKMNATSTDSAMISSLLDIWAGWGWERYRNSLVPNRKIQISTLHCMSASAHSA